MTVANERAETYGSGKAEVVDMIIQGTRIGVVGLGYVGLPVLSLFSRKYDCCGLDIDEFRIQQLLSGIDVKGSLSLPEVSDIMKRCDISSSWKNLSNCNFYIITVPTPIDKMKVPDTNALEKACLSLSQIISVGDIIVFESTVFPGATEELCIPILESGSKLNSNCDFFVGYSPERVNVGDNEHTLANTPKIVSAQNEKTLEIICSVYHEVFNAEILKASSIKTAEAAKMYENVQRDVLIALANQYSEYCRVEGLNIQEVTDCASTKWNFAKVFPGLVGGHCISVDPYYLLARAKEKDTTLELVATARSINEAKVEYVAKRIMDFAKKENPKHIDLKILILGISYKRNVSDIRNTKIADLIVLLSMSIDRIDCYDPLVNKEEVKNIYGLDVITSMSDIPKDEYDLAIIAVNHNCIAGVSYNAKKTINLEEFI